MILATGKSLWIGVLSPLTSWRCLPMVDYRDEKYGMPTDGT